MAREAEKKAIELARYVIPVAAFTSMVHTVSGIVLHRLYRMMRTGDTPTERVEVVTAMVDQVRALDPDFFERVGEGPLAPREVVEIAVARPARGRRRAGRGHRRAAGSRTSLLVDYTARATGDHGGRGADGAGRERPTPCPTPRPWTASSTPARTAIAWRR